MAIVRKEAYYHSANGRNMIRTLWWQDDAVTPIAVLQIAHGMAEHIGRYDEYARFLAEKGFIVCGNDHLGHGKSVQDISEFGYIDEKDGYVYMIRDMHTLYTIMHKRFPELPYFLFGHSLGSMLSRIYVDHFAAELAGVILCGTTQLPAGVSMLDAAVEDLMDRLGGRKVTGEKIGLSINMITSKLMGENDVLSWVSRSESNRESYRMDPLCGFPMQNAGNKNVALIGIKASDPEWAMRLPYGFPVMLIAGAKDPVSFNGKAVLELADLLMKAGNEPVVILYPGARHEVLNEDERERVYADTAKWLINTLNGVPFYN